MAPRILLHGSGAIGTVYLYLFLKAGCEVTAVCRSNYEAAKQNGFTLDSGRYGKGIKITPTNVVRSPAEAVSLLGKDQYFDYVVVCTKALPEAKTAETIKPAVTIRETTIVLIQNGIGIEDEYASTFHENPILSCVVYLPTTQTSPGHIEMPGFELLEVGTFPSSAYKSSPATQQACDTFISTTGKGGSNVHFYPDIQEQRWSKLLLNASWNPICALTLSRDVAFLASSPAAERLVLDVMDEVIAVARALGYERFTHELAQTQLTKATNRKGGKGIEPSMLVDVLTERRMEVEVILGKPIEVARRVGVAVPRMETLYALGKALDEAVALREQGKSLAGDETRAARGELSA